MKKRVIMPVAAALLVVTLVFSAGAGTIIAKNNGLGSQAMSGERTNLGIPSGNWISETLFNARNAADDAERNLYITKMTEYFNKPTAYQEKYRPSYHFSLWTDFSNDPNGMIWFNGAYHMFFQASAPFLKPGAKWGHVTTTDFLTFKHYAPALFSDENGDPWSGSVVVDENDTSGLFGGQSGLVMIYTHCNPSNMRQTQELAYSTDGINFVKYRGNPIMSNVANIVDYRDPKIFWHEPTQQWVMILAGGTMRLYVSKNLIDWEQSGVNSEIFTECPDMFELPVDGDVNNMKWVVTKGGRTYAIGTFDGRQFTTETNNIVQNYGNDSYAMQSYILNGGRRVGYAWMDNWANINRPVEAYSLPVEYSLRTIPGKGIRLIQNPAAEVNGYRGTFTNSGAQNIASGGSYVPSVSGRALEINTTISVAAGAEFKMKVLKGTTEETVIGYNADTQEVYIDRNNSGNNQYFLEKQPPMISRYKVEGDTNNVKLRIYVDHTSVEVFVNDGEGLITSLVYPDQNGGGVELLSTGGATNVSALTFYNMNPITVLNGYAP